MAPVTPQRPARWPLAILVVSLLLLGSGVWLYWPQLLMLSTQWQRTLNLETTQLLKQVADAPHRAGWALMALSLVYGIVHAAGPGHGKIVIATFLATHPTRIKTSLWLTLASSLLQGSVAIVLVTVCLQMLALSSRQLHLSSYWLEKGSYLLVIALGIGLVIRATRTLVQRLRAPRLQAISPLGHTHTQHCGCGHQHVPAAHQLEQATLSWRVRCTVVLSMGLRPCSGAIMMLLFAKVIGVYGWGVLSALAMAAGTALTVSLMALLVQLSRHVAVRLAKKTARSPGIGGTTVALVGGILLIAMGCLLWQSAQPVASGLRALF